MKKIFIILFMLIPLALCAQEKAIYRITYECDALHKKVRQVYRWNLDIGQRTAVFYSPNYRQHSKLFDSVQTSDNLVAAMDEIKRLAAKYPNRSCMEVLIGLPEIGHYTYINKAGIDNQFIYEEKMPAIEWQLTDSVKMVSGYRCHRAETEVYGRKWIVWYAPEIPLSYGPYILGGLPGLILEAVDSEHLFSFTTVGIENITDDSKVELFGEKEAIKCSRGKYLALRQKSVGQTYKEAVNQLLGGSSKVIEIKDASGKEISNQIMADVNYSILR